MEGRQSCTHCWPQKFSPETLVAVRLWKRERKRLERHDVALMRNCYIFYHFMRKFKNNVIFCRCCLHDTYLFLLWFLRADFVADVVGKYCWILLKMTLVFPQYSRDDYSWNLNCTWLFTGKINIFSKILNFGWAVKSCPFSFWNI